LRFPPGAKAAFHLKKLPPMKTNGIFSFLQILAPLLCVGFNAPAALVSFPQPARDVWVYENVPASNAGERNNAPVFAGPIGVGNGSDDRLGQMVMGWDTATEGIPAGLPLDNYQITRVTFKATHVNDEVFRYDSTYDGFASYLEPLDPDYVADTDTGRPLELYGLGLRNGYTELAVSGSISGTRYGEGSPFGPGTPGEHTRNAFAWSSGTPRPDGDISENVAEKFESNPFAIGINTDLDEGDLVPAETEFTFELNLADPGILNYLRQALHNGALGLTLSSLHPSAQPGQGGQSYPRFYTREYGDVLDEVVPQLEIEYSIIPEPSPGRVMIMAAAVLAMARGWRRRDRYS
jgi:hypothetical protein